MRSILLWEGAGLLAAAINLAIAALVYLRNRHFAYRSFAYLSFCLSLWNLCHIQVYPAYNDPVWMRLLFSTLCLMPAFSYAFAQGYLKDALAEVRGLKTLYVLEALWLASVWTPYFETRAWRVAFTLFLFPILFYCMAVFFWAYFRAASASRRNSLLYLCLAASVVVVGGLLEFLPHFGIRLPAFPYASLSMTVYSLLMAYAIQRYHLLDVSAVLSQARALGALALVTAGVSGLANLLAARLPEMRTSIIFLTLYLLLAATLLVWDRWGDRLKEIFFRQDYLREASVEAWMRSLQGVLDVDEITHKTRSLLRAQLQPEAADVLLIENSPSKLHPKEDLPPWEQYFQQVKAGVTLHELELRIKRSQLQSVSEPLAQYLRQFMIKNGWECLMPVISEGALQGTFVLGPRREGFYDARVMGWLGRVSASLSQALHTQRLLQEMMHADRLVQLGVVAAGIAHEIRNPIAYFKGALYMLQQPDVPVEKKNDMMSALDLEVDRLTSLVEDILSYAKPRVPKQEPCDVGGAIEEILKIIKPSFLDVGIAWAPPPSPVQVSMDSDHLKQIVLNLVRNAQQAMASGPKDAKSGKKGNIRVAVVPRKASVVIEVSDNGPGMPQEVAAKIFQPFTSGSEKGTGLGLAIVDKLIRLYRGRVWVSSKVGEGTLFTIAFPAFEPPAAPPAKP